MRISNTRRSGDVVVYGPDEIDYFFIVDGDLSFYLVPLEVVGGYQVINLRRYVRFIVGSGNLLAADQAAS